MNNTAEIKRRLASVRQTRQITGAMETISVAKMRKAAELVESNRPYFDALVGAAGDIARASDGESVFFKPKKVKALYIVITADRGLCGGFNHDVFKLADGLIDVAAAVLPVGISAYEHYKNMRVTENSVTSGSVDYGKASELGRYVISVYGKEYGAVYAVYTHMQNKALYAPRVTKILPLEYEKSSNGGKLSFEPSADEVLEKFIPVYVSGVLYGAMLNSCASEHAARHAAMSASAKNADAMISTLSAEQNNVRQSLVTEQITEIIGSTRALNGDRL